MSNKSGAITHDPIASAAARALAAGHPLAALNLVALRDDGPGLALRGIAIAQLGDLDMARTLLRSAGRACGPRDELARARCDLAVAEIALVTRDLALMPETLQTTIGTLERYGDRLNVAHARFIDARRLLLIGRTSAAEQVVATINPSPFPPALRAAYELVVAGIAIRRSHATLAQAALDRAAREARRAGIASLQAEVVTALRVLREPAARLIEGGRDGRLIRLAEVEEVRESGAVIVDACRFSVRNRSTSVSLAGRPVLFDLARALAEVWPDDVPRNTLIERAFEMLIDADEDRLRLRVEIGRLRTLLEPLASVIATKRGFALVPRTQYVAGRVVLIEPPVEEKHSDVIALLADGEAWSSSALALALNVGQRTVQRSLEELAAPGRVQSIGRGRACRWTASPIIGFATTLLLPGTLPGE